MTQKMKNKSVHPVAEMYAREHKTEIWTDESLSLGQPLSVSLLLEHMG